MRAALTLTLCGATALLGACEGGFGTAQGAPDLVVECQFEVDAPGSYEYPAGVAVPTVKPGADGTAEGALSLNACIRQKANAYGLSNGSGQTASAPVVTPAPTPAPRPAPVRTELPRSLPSTPAPTRQNASGCPVGLSGLYRGTLYCNSQ